MLKIVHMLIVLRLTPQEKEITSSYEEENI